MLDCIEDSNVDEPCPKYNGAHQWEEGWPMGSGLFCKFCEVPMMGWPKPTEQYDNTMFGAIKRWFGQWRVQ